MGIRSGAMSAMIPYGKFKFNEEIVFRAVSSPKTNKVLAWKQLS
jgi:hypothetical protein